MKLSVFVYFMAALLAGCSSTSDKQPAPVVTTDSLVGNWMIVNLAVSGNNQQKIQLMQSAIGPLKNTIELSILSFHPNGALQADDGNVTTSKGTWTLLADTLKLAHFMGENKEIPFIITMFQHDSLVMENSFDNSKDNLRVSYTLKQMQVPDSTISIFDAAENDWRVKPSQPESEAAMRARLKKMLLYYSAYFATLSKNKIPSFNREKIFCPLLYYDGSLGVRPLEENDSFIELFYNEADAKKGYQLLEKAFDGYTFPDLGNKIVQEYIIALKQLSERV